MEGVHNAAVPSAGMWSGGVYILLTSTWDWGEEEEEEELYLRLETRERVQGECVHVEWQNLSNTLFRICHWELYFFGHLATMLHVDAVLGRNGDVEGVSPLQNAKKAVALSKTRCDCEAGQRWSP